jgi:hypothetical protein
MKWLRQKVDFENHTCGAKSAFFASFIAEKSANI